MFADEHMLGLPGGSALEGGLQGPHSGPLVQMVPIWVQLGAIGVPNDGPLKAHVVTYNSFPRRVFSSTPDDIPHQTFSVRNRHDNLPEFALKFRNLQHTLRTARLRVSLAPRC